MVAADTGTPLDHAGNPVIWSQSTRRMVTLPGEATYADTFPVLNAAQVVRQILVAQRDDAMPVRV
jgi:hypothetical protein